MHDSLDLRKIAATPPPIPDKHAIVPIHTSDRGSFKRCRRYWHWNSPMRENLRAKVTLNGVNVPMWFGTGVHYALEQYSDPVLQRDPVETFQTWYVLQWEGGEVTQDELRLTYDPNPVKLEAKKHPTYRVRGLNELHPDPDEEEFERHRDLGIGMLRYYREWADREDHFYVIAAEHEFSVPLGFDSTDPRDGVRKPVHYRGRMDTVIQDLSSGRYGIRDYKTAERVDEDYFSKLEKDEQCTSYLWAAEKEASLYDLPYTEVDFVDYVVLRKAYPKPPTMTTRGLPSLDRQQESTTAAMFRQCIEENNLEVWLETNEKAQGYLAYLDEVGDENFIIRKTIHRNRSEIESADWRIAAEALDMLSISPGILTEPTGFPNTALYPNPTGDRRCTRCAFRAPCLAFDDGSDWREMINDGYEKQSDR